MIIGVTGSSGAGKTTLCTLFKNQYHAKIISADEIAKNLSQKGTEYFQKIVQTFGNSILLETGELNRKKLGELIYENEEKRALLNSCTFAYIKKEILLQIKQAKEEIVVIDAPLLFEAKLEEICDKTIAMIQTDVEKQIERTIQRDNIDRKIAFARLNAQQKNSYYIQRCDFTIQNDGSVEELEKALKNIIDKLSTK